MAALPVLARPTPDEVSPEGWRYVETVRGADALPLLAAQAEEIELRFAGLPEDRASHRYAPGKWSVKEVVGHLADAERIYAYRALRFARADATPLPGFDENLYVPAGRFDARRMRDLFDEWASVRAATFTLFAGLDAAASLRRGVANGHEVSVRALAWLALGHTQHHLSVLRERYGLR